MSREFQVISTCIQISVVIEGMAKELRPGIEVDDTGFKRYFCQGCREPHPGLFQVTDRVWQEAGFEIKWGGLICIACFAVKLGRPMALADFTDHSMNAPLVFGYKMGKRMVERLAETKIDQSLVKRVEAGD